MMTKEDAMLLYTDHDWEMYKFYNISKDTALELIRLSDEHPENICLGWHADKEYVFRNNRFFNMEDITFYLYYYERDIELSQKLENNNKLTWSDSDSYTLTDDAIADIKNSTNKTKQLIDSLFKLNQMFEDLTYKSVS